jgi:hypothetical protein
MSDDFVERLTAYLDGDGSHEGEAAEFAAVASQLRAPATWAPPPPALREAVLSRVREKATAPKQARRSRWGRLTWAVPVAALAAAAFTAVIIIADRALLPGPPAGKTYAAVGTQLAPDASATIVVSANPSGFSLRVQATGLPAAAPGSYYSAWLHGPRGIVPLGSFHQHQQGSAISLWSGVDPKDYTTLVITLQAEGQPPSPSDRIVMTAALN